MEIRIDSSDPQRIPGEIQVRGANVMLGYYKNEEATRESFTADGWFRTGDMGVLDADGYLYIKGRCKSMILGPSGQNIYPEEIESVLNNMPYVTESLVIGEDGRLTALICPDREAAGADGLDEAALAARMNDNLQTVNRELANYCQLSGYRMVEEEFEKTPKRSIKRYLYQRD